jgi:hypothetical protein
MKLTFSNNRTRRVSEDGIAQELKSIPHLAAVTGEGGAACFIPSFRNFVLRTRENMSQDIILQCSETKCPI